MQTLQSKETERNAKLLRNKHVFLKCPAENGMICTETVIIVGGEKKMDEARKSEENRTGRVHFDADGILHVQNSTLNWIPEIAFEEEVRGTTYTVTGCYEGNEMLDAKVDRLLAKGLQDFLEGNSEEEEGSKASEELEEFSQGTGETE